MSKYPPSPRPWTFASDTNGDDLIVDAQGSPIARVHAGEPADPELIVSSVNGAVTDEMVWHARNAYVAAEEDGGKPFDWMREAIEAAMKARVP